MTAVLPGFRQFRFPAKLFTFTALGSPPWPGWAGTASAPAAPAGSLSCSLLPGLEPRRARRGLDRPAGHSDGLSRGRVIASMFGPFDADGGFRAMVRSLVQASIVLGLGLVMVRQVRTRPQLAGSSPCC